MTNTLKARINDYYLNTAMSNNAVCVPISVNMNVYVHECPCDCAALQQVCTFIKTTF